MQHKTFHSSIQWLEICYTLHTRNFVIRQIVLIGKVYTRAYTRTTLWRCCSDLLYFYLLLIKIATIGNRYFPGRSFKFLSQYYSLLLNQRNSVNQDTRTLSISENQFQGSIFIKYNPFYMYLVQMAHNMSVTPSMVIIKQKMLEIYYFMMTDWPIVQGLWS